MSEQTIIRATMTADEYLQLPESKQPTQFIQGEKFVAPAPAPQHQLIIRNLFRVLDNTVNNGELLFAPADVRLGDNVVQPDIFWIRPDGDCVINGNYWQGAPNLVVEVLSPGTEKLDRGVTFDIYQEAGVHEYWLVEPIAESVEVHARSGDSDLLQRIGLYDANDTFTSPLFKTTIDLHRVFASQAQQPDDNADQNESEDA